MRTKFVILIVCIFIIAAQRNVVFELMTSTTCGVCPTAETTVDNIVAEFGHDRVIEIAYHLWWPSPGTDPFYAANTTENANRNNWYQDPDDMYTPHGYVDGFTDVGSSRTTWRTRVNSRLSVSSPVNVTMEFVSDSRVRAIVTPEAGYSGSNVKAFFLVTESNIDYNAPNGRTVFNGVMRKFFPDDDGIAVSLTPSVTDTFEVDFSLNPDWNIVNCRMIFFLQNMNTKEIYQAIQLNVPLPEFLFSLTSLAPSNLLIDPASYIEAKSELINLGTEIDNYEIRLVKDIPRGWTASLCISEACFDSFGTTELSPSEIETISVDIYPLNNEGEGFVHLIVNSIGNPALVDTLTYYASTGGDVILIDDDQGETFEDYYTSALDELGYSYFVIDRSEQLVDYSTLSHFDICIWFTGTPYANVLSSEDMSALGQYLDNSGKLFLTSPEVGWDNRDDPFYSNYLHAAWVFDDSDDLSIIGEDTHPISDELSFNIGGGDGADNQLYPDVIAPLDEYATPIFYYGDTDSCSALAIETDTYKVAYFGFGYEAINNPTDRRVVMERVLNWLGGGTLISNEQDDHTFLPNSFELLSMYPNPFNSTQHLVVDCNKDDNYELSIYNLQGRKVADYEYKLGKGKNRISWNGDALPTGIYLIRFSNSDGHRITQKTIYLK